MTDDHTEAFRRVLTGDADPLSRFGVSVLDVPWWRRRIQRYLMPNRYRLWWQREVLERIESGDTDG